MQSQRGRKLCRAVVTGTLSFFLFWKNPPKIRGWASRTAARCWHQRTVAQIAAGWDHWALPIWVWSHLVATFPLLKSLPLSLSLLFRSLPGKKIPRSLRKRKKFQVVANTCMTLTSRFQKTGNLIRQENFPPFFDFFRFFFPFDMDAYVVVSRNFGIPWGREEERKVIVVVWFFSPNFDLAIPNFKIFQPISVENLNSTNGGRKLETLQPNAPCRRFGDPWALWERGERRVTVSPTEGFGSAFMSHSCSFVFSMLLSFWFLDCSYPLPLSPLTRNSPFCFGCLATVFPWCRVGHPRGIGQRRNMSFFWRLQKCKGK